MWGTRNALEEDLAKTKEQTNANEIDVRLSAEDGVNAESQIVEDGVTYVQQGAGRITARSMNGETFDSNNDVLQTTIPKDEESSEETRNVFLRLLGLIMGRDIGALENDQNDLRIELPRETSEDLNEAPPMRLKDESVSNEDDDDEGQITIETDD